MVSWDAGALSFGSLLQELGARMDALAPGDRLHITSRDPAAQSELPVWCRATGHRLVMAMPPVYIVERKAG